MKDLKSKKGITLIALVITIIVLLILAGVTISAIVGENGIINKAKNAKEETKIGEEKDKISLALAEYELKQLEENAPTLEEFLESMEWCAEANQDDTSKALTITMKNGRKYEVDANGENIGEVEDVVPGKIVKISSKPYTNNGTAQIPVGFSVVPGCDDVGKGLVISDDVNDTEEDSSNIVANGNQFVWIPVKNAIVTQNEIAEIKSEDSTITTDLAAVQKLVDSGIYPMAVEVSTIDDEGNTITNYSGLLYEFTGIETLSLTVEDWTTTTSYKEPAVCSNDAENFVKYDIGEYYDTLYQDSYNSMVKSVIENGGFYVGRYEMSLYTDEQDSSIQYGQSKKDEPVYTTWGLKWYPLYKYERDFSKYNTNLGVVSEMIWGSQWDQMMIFVNGKDDGSETPSEFYVTKINSVDQVANIFNLQSNEYEWTMEFYSDCRVYRGGSSADNSNALWSGILPATQRRSLRPKWTSNYDVSTPGSRLSLYIK